MNINTLPVIFIAMNIALLAFCILKIYVKATINIIESDSDIMPEIWVASICILVISIYFLI